MAEEGTPRPEFPLSSCTPQRRLKADSDAVMNELVIFVYHRSWYNYEKCSSEIRKSKVCI